jgi:hypothetical protein
MDWSLIGVAGKWITVDDRESGGRTPTPWHSMVNSLEEICL